MTLRQWADNGWLKPHQTSPEEISSLLAIVERDLGDAGSEISPDWRFGIAYNAALKLCTILLYAEGYRPAHGLQHYRTLATLALILGPEKKTDVEYLDDCRKKRNILEYKYVGGVSESDAKELVLFVRKLMQEVIQWLKENHPSLL
jgi:hypothetical protein